MTCTPFKAQGGGYGIACTRGRPRCSKCGKEATLLCDAPREGAHARALATGGADGR